MKRTLIIFLVTLPLFSYSQNYYELKLSDTLNETRMGLWEKGDYRIYVELDLFETHLQYTAKGYLSGGLENNSEDSIAKVYNLSSKRFQVASEQLKKAANGYDLRNLIVYYGPENKKENSGNSALVENIVRQFLESGRAKVMYKDKRVFTLKKRYDTYGEGLDFGYSIKIFFDDEENYTFKYIQLSGW